MKLPFFGKRQVKESIIGRAMVMTPGQPAWSGRNYESFADEAYTKNAVAYAAIKRVADAVASVRWTAWKGENELAKHPALDVLGQPNPAQSGPDYIRAKVGYYLISGNGYEEGVTIGGRVKEIYQWRPDRVKVIPGDDGFAAAYEYQANGRKRRIDVDIAHGKGDLRHLKMFNPLNDWYGMSPIEAGAYSIDQSNESAKWIQALLQNSAKPSGALMSQGTEALTEEQFARLKAQIEDQYQGSANAGRPMLLEGGLDWKQMGLSPVDMGILDVKYSSNREVALAFGVPPQLLGIPGDNTYSNYQEARLAFWEDTVIPLCGLFAQDWTAWLGDGAIIKPDYDDVPAIADKKATQWKMANDASFLTVNEKRQIAGFGEIEGGDRLQERQLPPETVKRLAYGN